MRAVQGRSAGAWMVILLFGSPYAMASTANSSVNPEAGVYTTYSRVGRDGSVLSWTTCGQTQNRGGCFTSGTLKGVKRACALLEGKETLVGDTSVRSIYVIDGGNAKSTSLSLAIYTKTQQISDSYVNTTIRLSTILPLSNAGGSQTSCYLAANGGFLFAGTNQEPTIFKIHKNSLEIETITTEAGGPVTSISANDAGYVVVDSQDGIYNGGQLFDPEGVLQEYGGGAFIVPNMKNGFLFN